MRLFFVIFCAAALVEAGKNKKSKEVGTQETKEKTKREKRREKKANKPKEEPEIDPDDPLIVKLFDVEARVTAWNDQFGADALRKERITRKISNTMRDLIAKTRSAARNSDCRESIVGFRSGNKKEVKAEAQVLRKIDDITNTYQAIADEYIAGCPEYNKIINLSTVLQKRMKKSYDRAVRKEALKILAENKASEMLEKEQAKALKAQRAENKKEAQSLRESKKANKEEAQAERERKAENKQKRKDLKAEKEIKKEQRG